MQNLPYLHWKRSSLFRKVSSPSWKKCQTNPYACMNAYNGNAYLFMSKNRRTVKINLCLKWNVRIL